MTNREKLACIDGLLTQILDGLDVSFEACSECECKQYDNYDEKCAYDKIRGTQVKLLNIVDRGDDWLGVG